MITKKVNRYYCEHCHKGGQSAACISRHEASCRMNPARVCRHCEAVGETPKPMAELVALVPCDAVVIEKDDYGCEEIHDEGAYDAALPALRDATENCPMCILAALSQAGYPFLARTFEFKKELAAFWAQVEADRSEERNYVPW